jgi:hypothetical protein
MKTNMSIVVAIIIPFVLISNYSLSSTDAEKTAEVLSQASPDVVMHPEYAKSIARMAYIWGYPMVNMMNRRAS